MYSCLELFSGIGGFAIAAEQMGWKVARAIDINQHASEVYRLNFNHTLEVRTIESIPLDELAEIKAELWWMSPPCQPFTRRGAQRGLKDARSEAFLHVVEAIQSIKPSVVALENVPEFRDSSAADHLRAALERTGYQWNEWELCPSELGIPNRRRRFYLVAALDFAPIQQAIGAVQDRSLASYLDPVSGTAFEVSKATANAFEAAIDRVDPSDDYAMASCFTSAYGKSPVQSGSYLLTGNSLRRFSPREIVRLLGFPDRFQLPSHLTHRQQWKLVGNSLSIPVLRHCLASIETGLRR